MDRKLGGSVHLSSNNSKSQVSFSLFEHTFIYSYNTLLQSINKPYLLPNKRQLRNHLNKGCPCNLLWVKGSQNR